MGKYILTKITSIKRETLEHPKKVYDFSVEDDHSYLANSYVVHNCITSSNTSIHFPMASLISEIYEIKKELIENGQVDHLPAIVADGGVRGYSDVIKALALGADYVMIGSVFAKMLESAAPGQVIIKDKNYDLMKFDEILYEGGKFQVKEENGSLVPATIVKTFYGMASKKGQLAMNGKKTHTSEGIETTLNVEYTMQAWVENFTDYLRSAMSYVGVRDLQCFKEQTDLVINSQLTVQGINK